MRARPESITAVDALDRHRRLGDVRRQDDLAAVAGAHGARLLLERHLAVQRQHGEAADARAARRAPPARAGSRRRPAGTPARRRPCRRAARGARRPRPARPAADRRALGRCSIATSNMRPSLRTTSPPRNSRDRIGVERRRHRHDGQVGPVGLAQAPQPGEREIGRDVALVKLVEHDGADAGQARRGQHAAGRRAPRS